MKRNLRQLADEQYDVLVVGGGIYGAAVARAAAINGFKVALIEKNDFGHATSANSQKIIHGGLRYLQHLNIIRMRESIIARRQLLKFAPHLVKPLKFLIPTYGYGLRSRPVMALALGLNDLISGDRNSGVPAEGRLPGGQTVSKDDCLKMIPGLDPSAVTGGAIWFDAMASNTERLTLMFVTAAAKHGASVANYVRAKKFLSSGNNVEGVTATDQLSDQEFDIRAKAVVNASGPWINDMHGAESVKSGDETLGWAKAMNIVVSRPLFDGYAVGLSAGPYIDTDAILSKGARDFFFVPWRDGTIIGTSYRKYRGSAESCSIRSDDISDMLDAINRAYPAAKLERKEICHIQVGLLPARSIASNASGDIQLFKNTIITDHSDSVGLQGLRSVVGVKYTTANQVADRLIRTMTHQPLQTRVNNFDNAKSLNIDEKQGFGTGIDGQSISDKLHTLGLEQQTIDYLQSQYRPEFGSLLNYLKISEHRKRLTHDRPNIEAEIHYFVAEEMAQTLSDVVFRRSDLGTAGFPGNTAIRNCAAVMARACDWSENRIQQELDSTLQVYQTLRSLGCGPSDPVSVTAKSVLKRLES